MCDICTCLHNSKGDSIGTARPSQCHGWHTHTNNLYTLDTHVKECIGDTREKLHQSNVEEYIGDQSTSNRRVGDNNQLGNYIGYQHIGYTRGGILVDNDMSRARVGLAGKMFGLTTGRTAPPCLAQARLCCRMALRHDCITKPDGLRSAVSFFMTSLNTRPSFAAMSTFASTPRALRA